MDSDWRTSEGLDFLVILLEAGTNATALVLVNKIQERKGRKDFCESEHMLHMGDLLEKKPLLHETGRQDYFVDKEDLSIKETLYSLGSCLLNLSFFLVSCLCFWRDTTKTSLVSLR